MHRARDRRVFWESCWGHGPLLSASPTVSGAHVPDTEYLTVRKPHKPRRATEGRSGHDGTAASPGTHSVPTTCGWLYQGPSAPIGACGHRNCRHYPPFAAPAPKSGEEQETVTDPPAVSVRQATVQVPGARTPPAGHGLRAVKGAFPHPSLGPRPVLPPLCSLHVCVWTSPRPRAQKGRAAGGRLSAAHTKSVPTWGLSKHLLRGRTGSGVGQSGRGWGDSSSRVPRLTATGPGTEPPTPHSLPSHSSQGPAPHSRCGPECLSLAQDHTAARTRPGLPWRHCSCTWAVLLPVHVPGARGRQR